MQVHTRRQVELEGYSPLSRHIQLPVEVLEAIFALACTDNGRTGCALSRVSKFVRTASRAVRFTTVELRAQRPSQVSRFLSTFTAQLAEADALGSVKPRVRHLFLATATQQHTNDGPKYRQSVQSLLELVSPSLKTLFVLRNHRKYNMELRFPDLHSFSFPMLQELHLFGSRYDFLPPSPCSWNIGAAPSRQVLLPRLTHLHLSDTSTLGNRVELSRWAASAPNVRYLRLSDVKYSGLTDLERLGGEPHAFAFSDAAKSDA